MPAPSYCTWLEVVNLVARSVGHPVTTDVAASEDEAIQRLGFYANQACVELLTMSDWQSLIKTGTIAIVADSPGQTEKGFDLPTDFDSFVDHTQWNSDNQLPAVGPVSPQDWQWLIVREAQITTRFMWRIRADQLWIKSPPVASQDFTFEYISKNWAVDEDGTTPKELMTKNGDYHLFAWNLVVLFTRFKWFKGEGYDASSAEKDFNRALEAYSSDKGASALSLVPGMGDPLISMDRNAPDTGYGS